MVREIREQILIEEDGALEVHHPDLAAGAKADVIIRVQVGEPARGGMSSVLDAASEAASLVPDEEWALLPRDLSKHLDHYLYGGPKGET